MLLLIELTKPATSPSEAGLDASLCLIESLATCVMSARLCGGHRQWAIQQLVKCLSTRASVFRITSLDSINYSDVAGVLPKCPTTDAKGHGKRISCIEWSEKKKLFASWYVMYTY
jgi:hypothetical protein